MVIPWVVAGAVALLVTRWVYLWLEKRADDRAFEYRMRARRDLWKLL